MTFARRAVRSVLATLGAAACVLAAGRASATWSIVIINTRTGEVALASATCLTNFDLEANTPVLLPLIGGATCQSAVDQFGLNRTYIRDRMLQGVPLAQILSGLSTFDPSHQIRQYGLGTVHGGAGDLGETLTFTGTGAGQWAGGQTGRVGDLVYAVQGNVLTGDPVVTMAVAAIVNTPGDIAAKLMAGMEAARLMGGDGRCSCLTGSPPSCGSPPPSFTKSAHIAYMLIAREGDIQNCRASYPTARGPQNIMLADLNGDGLLDPVVAAAGAPSSIGITLNNTGVMGRLGVGPAMLAPAFSIPTGGVAKDVVAADFNLDGRMDLVASNGTSVLVYLANDHGGFFDPLTLTAGLTPSAVLVRDFNNDAKLDIVCANTGTNDVSVFPGHNDGTFSPAIASSAGTGTTMISAADFNADAKLDLISGNPNVRNVTLLTGDGAGNFARVNLFATSTVISHVLATDLDADGTPEIVVCGTGENFVRVYKRVAGAWTPTNHTVASGVSQAAAADIDADGKLDLVVLARTSSQLGVLKGIGDGTFEAARTFATGFSPARMSVGDLDADSDLDVAYSCPGGSSVVIMSNLTRPGGAINFGEAGCASGQSYMDFNVANRQAGDPDPVFTLREQYVMWRNALVHVPDAIESTAAFDPGTGPGDGRTPATLHVQLRDWRGVDTDALGWNVDAQGTTARTVGVRSLGAGRFDLDIVGTRCGLESITVRASNPDLSVTLMPHVAFAFSAPADFDSDGALDFFDYDAFRQAWEARDPRTDRNADATIDATDLAMFLDDFEAGC